MERGVAVARSFSPRPRCKINSSRSRVSSFAKAMADREAPRYGRKSCRYLLNLCGGCGLGASCVGVGP